MTPEPEAKRPPDSTAAAPTTPTNTSKPGVQQPDRSLHNAATPGEAEEEEEEDEDEDTEPKLKYSRLTGSLGPVYRNGDATSSSMVAGDKLMLGTHNGNVNVFSIPTFRSLRTYKAHSASVTSISVSPFPPPWPTSRDDAPQDEADAPNSPGRPQTPRSVSNASPRATRPYQTTLPAIPSNTIYIATSSIDGNVCVSSLIDAKDVLLRNFGRPVQAVALSPDYKNDRTYLSGGLAGQLILTVGGKVGVSAKANTNSTAAAAQGWLGSIGLGSNAGRDTSLHANEGTISIIKWSLSGRFVLWVNEQGIKIMRSHIKLDSEHLDDAWQRIGHIDKPNRRSWQDMASVWKSRVEWVDEDHLESDESPASLANGSHPNPLPPANASDSLAKLAQANLRTKKKRLERAVVGWGDTAWIIQVKGGGPGSGKQAGEHVVGSADIVHKLLFDDCIISGISLYTPSLLVILAYRTHDDDDSATLSSTETTPRRGLRQKQNGLQPELRLVEASSGSEVDVDTLTFSRFESLSAADYHLNTLFVPPISNVAQNQKGTFESINSALWGAGASTARLLTSGASILSLPTSTEKSKVASSQGSTDSGVNSVKQRRPSTNPNAETVGLKIFIQSPYDCVLAVRREPADHLDWLVQHSDYEKAYELIDQSPQIIGANAAQTSLISPTPRSPALSPQNDKEQRSLVDFFADDTLSQTDVSVPGAVSHAQFSAAEKEKRRIGDLWVRQLFDAHDYASAGRVAGRVLGTSPMWERWVLAFAEAGKLDDIAQEIPAGDIRPPLPGLIYEVVLGHYIAHDPRTFKELLERFDPPQYDTGSVTSAIEAKLRARDDGEQLSDENWRILTEGLARLLLADGRAQEALKCYIRVQNAEEAIRLVRDLHLLGDIVDDIPGFLMLRLSKKELETSTMEELEDAASEPLTILIDEAYTGVLRPSAVVRRLQSQPPAFRRLLFLYLRALWTGQLWGKTDDPEAPPRQRRRGRERLLVEGRTMVEEFGDLAVDLFAEHDRDTLMQFLRNSTTYGYEHASSVCEERGYIQELVYLLSKTGQTKRALQLITTSLDDPLLAIVFAKEQADPDLWSDLLDYSMDTSDPKPRFIHALLAEAGTSIDPITLVRRIPDGLEVEGLRDAVRRLVREFDIQGSISEGVAKVLRSEVAAGLETLRDGRKRGIKFEVALHGEDDLAAKEVAGTNGAPDPERQQEQEQHTDADIVPDAEPTPGRCVGCQKVFIEDEMDTLVGFACGHVHHLTCLLSFGDSDATDPEPSGAILAARRLQAQIAHGTDDDDDSDSGGRSVAAKTTHARVIGGAIAEALAARGRGKGNGGVACPVCVHRRAGDELDD